MPIQTSSLPLAGSMLFLLLGGPVATPGMAQSTEWLPLGGPPSAHVAVLVETSSGELLAGDLNGGLFRSSDGGASWALLGLGDAGVRTVTFAESGRLLVGTVTGEVYLSDDDGLTWIVTSPPGISDVYAITESEGGSVYVSGDGGICRSDDGGATWQSLDLGMPQIMIWSILLTIGDETVLTGSRGMGAVKSTDRGSTWVQIFPGSPDNIFYQFIKDQTDRIFTASALGIFVSADDGATWDAIPDPPNGDVRAFAIEPDGDYVASTSSIPYRSSNEGASWEPAGAGLFDLRIVTMIVRSDGLLLGGTNGDGVYASAVITSIAEPPLPPPHFGLVRTYPNPFNGISTLEFRIVETKEVSLKIYDLAGHEVTTLVRRSLTPGIYRYQWDAAENPSGVYFYQLRTGSSTVTGKMMLLR